MDNEIESVKSDHQCTSVCGNTKDCPVCPHGYDEENFCKECDEVAEEIMPPRKNFDFDNPYRHIEEANEENYKAVKE